MVSRAIAASLGGFTLLNLAGGLLRPGFDCNLWWIDLRTLPGPAAFLFLVATALLAHAVRPPAAAGWRRWVTIGLLLLTAAATLGNIGQFYALLAAGRIRPAVPLPLSALVAGALAWIAYRTARPAVAIGLVRANWRPRLAAALAVVACAVAFPLAQMVWFGTTDYRRPADAVVVFGARAYADGTPSLALHDRVATACRLYHEGRAPLLVFSGGPGDGPVDEPQAMRRLALSLGVPDAAIVLDPAGVSTAATVRNTDPIFRRRGVRRVLAVSHAYHLPRVKMAYRRGGWDVYTVPAEESRSLRRMPFLVAREVAAVWAYYLAPLAGS